MNKARQVRGPTLVDSIHFVRELIAMMPLVAQPGKCALLAAALIVFISCAPVSALPKQKHVSNIEYPRPPRDESLTERMSRIRRAVGPDSRDALVEELAHYEQLHEDVLSGKDPDGKYLVFSVVKTGAGNKLEGAVSAFLFALATKRVFIMDRTWATLYAEVNSPLDIHIESMVAAVGPDVSKRGTTNEVSMGTDFMCSGNLTDLYTSKILRLNGNQYFAPLIAHNPTYRDWVNSLFGTGIHQKIFQPLYAYLLPPSQSLKSEMNRYKQKYHWEDKYVIGLQVRATELYMEPDQVPEFWRCALALEDELAEQGIQKEDILYYLATDYAPVRAQAKEALGADRVAHGNWQINKQVTAARIRFSDRQTMTDILMLGECDDVLVTCGSSFGRVATSRSGIAPLVVPGYEKMCRYPAGPATQCYRTKYSEPRAWSIVDLVKGAVCSSNRIKMIEKEMYNGNRVQ